MHIFLLSCNVSPVSGIANNTDVLYQQNPCPYSLKFFQLCGCNSIGHLHCNKLHKTDILDRNYTAGKILYGAPLDQSGDNPFRHLVLFIDPGDNKAHLIPF